MLNKYNAVDITTTIRKIAVEVYLNHREGLPQACGANFDDVRTIAKMYLSERIGVLRADRIPEVKRALGFAVRWKELMDVG